MVRLLDRNMQVLGTFYFRTQPEKMPLAVCWGNNRVFIRSGVGRDYIEAYAEPVFTEDELQPLNGADRDE